MKKILIVDDDPEILGLLKVIMELDNYSVKTINKGALLKEALDSYAPDLIILDVLLGDSNGKDLCTFVKQKTEYAEIPIIMISGTSNKNDVFSGTEADDYLSKPFELVTLREKIKAQLN